MFDWLNFLRQYNIEYQESGPNVAAGNVNIQCPICGYNDPSFHMGISLHGKGWSCWRNRQHSGKNPVKLVRLLTGCSYEQAKSIVGSNVNIPENLMDKVLDLMSENKELDTKRILKLPKEFRSFFNKPSARYFIQYLEKRGFKYADILKLTKRYGIRYCNIGSYKGRVIFPVYRKGRLITWTGRSIYPMEQLRYKNLSDKEEKAKKEGYPHALSSLGKNLLWFDKLMKTDAETIFLVEGPFDALKISVLGKKLSVCSTCFFTSTPSVDQINLLHKLLPRFKRRIILPDQGALSFALQTQAELSSLNVQLKQLPKNVDDPGELDGENLGKLIS